MNAATRMVIEAITHKREAKQVKANESRGSDTFESTTSGSMPTLSKPASLVTSAKPWQTCTNHRNMRAVVQISGVPYGECCASLDETIS